VALAARLKSSPDTVPGRIRSRRHETETEAFRCEFAFWSIFGCISRFDIVKQEEVVLNAHDFKRLYVESGDDISRSLFSATYGHGTGIFSFVLASFPKNFFRITMMLGYPLFQVGIVLRRSCRKAPGGAFPGNYSSMVSTCASSLIFRSCHRSHLKNPRASFIDLTQWELPRFCRGGSKSFIIRGVRTVWACIVSTKPLTPTPLPLFPLRRGKRGKG
jgi:hypothetical protein